MRMLYNMKGGKLQGLDLIKVNIHLNTFIRQTIIK